MKIVKVEIYTRYDCVACDRAKRLLQTMQLPFIEYNLDEDPLSAQELILRPHAKPVVPQIFFNEHHLGGWQDLQQVSAMLQA